MRLAWIPAFVSMLMLGLVPASAAKTDFGTSIDGRTYSGSLKAQVELANGSRITKYGKATIQIDPGSAGSATMTVIGTIDGDENSASFKSDGKIENGGWTSPKVKISADGTISGEVSDAERRVRFSGKATATRIRLVTELVFLKATGPEYPAGTTFEFRYSTSRKALPEPANGKPLDSGKCKSIRYEMRPTANLFGGAMGMISVPVCVKE